MKRPDLCLKEPPNLPFGEVEAFALDGAYDFASPASKEGTLRSAGILARVNLSADAARRVMVALHNPKTYGGEPARCFIPRHGLRFVDHARAADVLFCLECHWVYFFYDVTPVVASLSEPGARWLETFFGKALNPE